ncbi:MAG: hydroxyethylthiazole kinase [Mycoplasma sp.]
MIKINNLETLKCIKEKKPLIHCITNAVTMNDCANALIAFGASPIMSENLNEIKEISKQIDGLYINIGTLTRSSIRAMYLAMKCAKKNNVPVVLDPVGVNVSKIRKHVIRKLIKINPPSAIKANQAEIRALFYNTNIGKGVDSIGTKKDFKITTKYASFLSKKINSNLLITGENDIITDGKVTYTTAKSVSMMQSFTGSGCILGAILCAAIAANGPGIEPLIFTSYLYGICGKKVSKKSQKCGNITFKGHLIDEIYKVCSEDLEKAIYYEIK